MNAHDALTLLVLVLTPLATMVAVRIQLRGQADRDLYHFHRQRLEARDATLRAAYVKVLRAAELLTNAVQDLGMFPRGRPHIERSEVFAGGTAQTVPLFVPIPRDDGDYSRAQGFMDTSQQVMSEATIDLGVEHEEDSCLAFFDEHFDRPFWRIYVEAVSGSGPIPDLDKTLGQMRDDQKQLAALARQSREAILAAPTSASRWRRMPGR